MKRELACSRAQPRRQKRGAGGETAFTLIELLVVIAIIAVLAASSGMAQSSVYSSNIVGYATVTVPPGFSILANPLSAGATNGAAEIGTG